MTLNAMHPDILVVRHHASGAVELLAQQGRLLGRQCGRRRARASDAGAARCAHHPPQQGPHRGPHGRDLRRHPAFARRALEHHVAQLAWARACAWSRPRRCCRPASSASASRSPRHARGARRRRHRDDAAPAARAHERLLRSVERRSTSTITASTQKKLAYAKPDALVMHPGPMNRGVEIDSPSPTARNR